MTSRKGREQTADARIIRAGSLHELAYLRSVVASMA
jgi:hypothetical protein